MGDAPPKPGPAAARRPTTAADCDRSDARRSAAPVAPADGTRDVDPFDRLVAAEHERIRRLVRRLMGWRDGVEDVVQEVFVAALRNWNLRLGADPSAWLTGIAIRQVRAWQRRQYLRLRGWVGLTGHGRHAGANESGAERAAAGDASSRLVSAETSAVVRRAVASLPAKLREVIVLRYLEDFSIEAIAQVLGVSRGGVDVRLNRARGLLRARLGEPGARPRRRAARVQGLWT